MWVTTLSTIKSVTNTFISWGEKTKKKRNNNLWEVCFSSAAVVSKLLLGCSGHFLFILCHWNPTVHSLTCTIHVQLQRTAWNVTFLPRRATKVKFFTPWYFLIWQSIPPVSSAENEICVKTNVNFISGFTWTINSHFSSHSEFLPKKTHVKQLNAFVLICCLCTVRSVKIWTELELLSLTDLRGLPGMRPPPFWIQNLSFSCSFWGKIGLNNRLSSPPWRLAPPLDPPLVLATYL